MENEPTKKPHVPKLRTINIFILAMLSMAVVLSLRNLPLTSTYGLSSVFFYGAAALLFMIPYALVSAELASGWPKAGGIYAWVREALGERFGFFAIWMQWFHNMTWYPAMLAFIGSGIAYIFAPQLTLNKIYLTSVIIIGFWLITLLNFLGLKISSWFSSFCLLLGTILPGLILIALAITWIIQGNPSEISLHPKDLLPDFHLSNLIFLAGIFLALSGLEVNANLAREVKNPQRNFPKAIFIAAIMTLIVLILGSLAIGIVIPKKDISLVSGLIEAFDRFLHMFHMSWLVPIIAISLVIGALGELNAWTIAAAKGIYATVEHGSLPPFFHKLNNHHMPTRLLLFQAMIVTITAFVFVFLPSVNISYWILNAVSAQMYILMYMLLFISALVLRYKKPHVERMYKVPYKNVGMWVLVVLGLLACLFALFFSFFVPPEFEAGNIVVYESLIIMTILINCLIPLLIYQWRKPHWKVDILQEIREEIHKNVH